MSTLQTKLDANWSGSFAGFGHLQAGDWHTKVSLPKEFGGQGRDASPEDMLLGAFASCYLITLSIMLHKAGIEFRDLRAKAELATDVALPPKIRVAELLVQLTTDADKASVEALGQKAESWCLVSQAIAGNVEKVIHFDVLPATGPLVSTNKSCQQTFLEV